MRARVGIILIVLAGVVLPSRVAMAAAAQAPEQVTIPPSTAAPTTTVAPTSTIVAPTTTSRPTTTTTRPATTTTSTSTSTTVPTTTTTVAAPTTTTGTSSSDTSGTTVGLIVAAVVAVLFIIGMLVFLLRRRARQQWRDRARGAAAEASSLLGVLTAGLAALDEPTRAARTWSDLEARGVHLHGRFQTLTAEAPDERDRIAITGVDRDLQSLRSAVEADRSLRVGPPPPTAEQLGYAEAVIRQRAADFEQSLGDLDRHLAKPI